MTISTQSNKVTYICNGSTHEFSFSFPISEDTDLTVTVIDPSEVEEVLVLDSSYTVSESDVGYSGGGTVTTTAVGPEGIVDYAYSSGYKIRIQRNVPQTQGMDLRTGQTIDLQDVEDALDKLTMLVIDLQKVVDRCIKVPEQDTIGSTELEISSLRSGKFINFDEEGDAQSSSGPILGTTPSSFMETVLDDTSAAEARTTLGVVSESVKTIISSPYNCDGTETILVVSSATEVIINLCSTNLPPIPVLRILSIGSGSVTINASSPDKIGADSSIVLSQQWLNVTLVCTPGVWVLHTWIPITTSAIMDQAVTVDKMGRSTNGKLLIGQTSASPAWTEVTGDITISAGGVTTYGIDALRPFRAGGKLEYASITSTDRSQTSPYKVSEAMVLKPGTIRVYFELTSVYAGLVYGRIYRNGSAVGTLRSVSAAGATSGFTEDISGWSSYDYVQLYIWTTSLDYVVRGAALTLYSDNPLRNTIEYL